MFSTNYYDEHPHGVTVHENTTSASYLKASNYHYFQPQILVQLRILTVDVSFSLLRTTQTCCGPRLLSFLVQNKKLWLTCLTLSSRGKEMKIIIIIMKIIIMIIEINCNRLEVEFQGPLCTVWIVCNECIIMGFGDIYMVQYIPGIVEELLVHCTATIWE